MTVQKQSSTITANGICKAVLGSSYPELASIEDQCWHQALGRAKAIHVDAASSMLHDVPRVKNFKLLTSGQVRVYHTATDGREITLYRVKAGDLCVLSLNSIFNEDTHGIISQAETDLTLVCIQVSDFHTLMRECDQFRNYILSHINKRTIELMGMVQDTAFNTLALRLACLLGRLFEREQTTTIMMTHYLLARELGTTREVVSRILKYFERQGCIRLSRGCIELASQAALSSFTRID